MDDQHLMQYINELFSVYDADHSGKLQPAELHWFFNDLFARLGDPRRYNAAELMIIFKEGDVNHDGTIDKQELFRLCKMIFNKNPYVGTVTVYSPPPQNHVYAYRVQRVVPVGATTVIYHH